MDVVSDLAGGKRSLEEDHGGEFASWDCSGLPKFKRLNAVSPDSSSEENIEDAFSYISELFHDQDLDLLVEKSQFSEMEMDFYNVCRPLSPQDHLNEFLNGLLTESESEGLFRVPENESRVPDVLNSMTSADNSFKVSGTKKLYSGPTLTDVQSALSSYGREDQNVSASASSIITVSNSGTVFDSLSNNKSPLLRSQHWFPDLGPKIDLDAFSRGPNRSFSSSVSELFYRRLYRSKSEARYSLKIKCPGNSLDDGYKWRKYGQKAIKNSPHPRSYYRCTNPRCCAKKQVERCVDDPDTITITYEGLHLHYSYSPFPITSQQHPNYSLRQPSDDKIYEKENSNNKIIAPIDNGFNGRFDKRTHDSMQASHSANMVGLHQSQQLLHPQPQPPSQQLQKDKYCESLGFGEGYLEEFNGRNNYNVGVNGVVEEEGGARGGGDGLLQDIVPLGIRNPLSCSSTTTSSSSSCSSP